MVTFLKANYTSEQFVITVFRNFHCREIRYSNATTLYSIKYNIRRLKTTESDWVFHHIMSHSPLTKISIIYNVRRLKTTESDWVFHHIMSHSPLTKI